MNILDKLPPQLRHFAIVLLVALLTWLGSTYLPALQDKNPGLVALASAVVAQVLLYITPLTAQYGVGHVAQAKGRHAA